MGGFIPEEHFEAWECLSRIVEYLYCQGRNGSTIDSTAIFHEAVVRYNILIEKSQGLTRCHVVNHNLTHISEDVLNFGSLDNFWCYNFERAVGRYIAISTNYKNLEITFARAELRREILKVRSSLKCQEVGSEEIIDYPEKVHFRSLAELENTIQHLRVVQYCRIESIGKWVIPIRSICQIEHSYCRSEKCSSPLDCCISLAP